MEEEQIEDTNVQELRNYEEIEEGKGEWLWHIKDQILVLGK